MHSKLPPTLIGSTLLTPPPAEATGGFVQLLGETFYKIQNYDAMPPFFMSIVSGADHWLFVASTGGLSGGRVNAERALFPYYTEDKLTENSENTGVKTILRVTRNNQTWLWEPFSIRQDGQYQVERNLYKNIPGTMLVFEEINQSLELVIRFSWRRLGSSSPAARERISERLNPSGNAAKNSAWEAGSLFWWLEM